jgi:FkbM family methyltransferase
MRQSINIFQSIKNIGYSPVVRIPARAVLKCLNLHKPTIERNHTLAEAFTMLGEKISLDFSKRYGVNLFHNENNSLIARGLSFEPEVQECLCCLLFLDRMRGNASRFGDIGANIGLHTLFLKDKFPDLEIVAFDPSPFSWKYLDLTLRYNQIQGVTLNKIALGDCEGTVNLYTWGESSAGDSLRNTERQTDLPFELVPVRMTSLDAFPESGSLTVIKMDCEGAEINILKGMGNVLERDKPLIITEFNNTNQRAFGLTSDDVYSFVQEIGYSIYTLWFTKLERDEFSALHQKNEENYVLLPVGFSV